MTGLSVVVVVQASLASHSDVNAQGGVYGNALQAASYRGFGGIVKMLLECGADVNAQEGGRALRSRWRPSRL